jgi:hypothetical protein
MTKNIFQASGGCPFYDKKGDKLSKKGCPAVLSKGACPYIPKMKDCPYMKNIGSCTFLVKVCPFFQKKTNCLLLSKVNYIKLFINTPNLGAISLPQNTFTLT